MSFGLKGRFLQPAAANGFDTCAVAPSEPCTDAVICFASQLVGLNMNPARVIATLTVWIRSGIPSTICGSGSLVTVSALVLGSTLMAERTTTLPRLNGPATAGTTMLRPNGAPR